MKSSKKHIVKRLFSTILILVLLFEIVGSRTIVYADDVNDSLDTNNLFNEEENNSNKDIEIREKYEDYVNDSEPVNFDYDEADTSVEVEEQQVIEGGRDILTLFPSINIIDSVSFYLNGEQVSGEIEALTDDTIKVIYDWSIPNSILSSEVLKNGDYVEIDQPNGISAISGNGNLGEYGTYSFVDGKIRLTFNSKIETDENIKGTVEFTQTINTYTESGQKEITVPILEKEEKIVVFVKPEAGSSISKSTSGISNDNKIVWEVSINTEMDKIVEGAKVEDFLPKNLTVENIKVYEQNIDLYGKVISRGKEATGITINDSTVIFDGSQGNKSYVIVITTSFKDEEIPANGGELVFANKAEFTNGKDSIAATASAKRNYEKFIMKSNSKENNELGNHIYDWSIKYNNNSKKLKSGSWVQDELPLNSDSIIIKDSVKVYTADGKELEKSFYNISYENNRIFRVNFIKDIDFKVEIKYRTKFNGIISGNDKPVFNNNATTSEGFSSVGKGTITEQGLRKWASIDYNSREITWNIEVNKAMYHMENWSLEDRFSVGQSYVPNSFKIDGFKETDYNLEIVENGFNLSLIEPTSKKFIISYKTKFEPLELIKTDKGVSRVVNTVTHKWIDKNGKLQEATREVGYDIKNDFVLDASKSGYYNAQTKEITWRIISNYRQEKIINGTIVDKIQLPQEYAAGSGKLVKVSIKQDGSIVLGEEIKNAIIMEPTDDNIISVNLPEGSNFAYALIFNTKLKDHIIENPYKNIAVYKNNNREQEVIATVSIINEKNYLEKNSILKETNSIIWSLGINKSQSTIKDLVIVDKPSSNQIIKKDSIKIYNAIPKADNSGVFTKGDIASIDYKIDLEMNNDTGEQTLTIKFNEEISKSYFIEYAADILATNNKGSEHVSNSVIIYGSGTKEIFVEKKVEDVVTTTGGTGQGETTSVTFEKIDSNNSKLKLPLVKLELWSTKNDKRNIKLREGFTDEMGRLTFGGLRTETDYLLFEVEASKGYTISKELLEGKPIRLSSKHKDDNIIQIENELSLVKLKKVSSNNREGLKDAEFNIKQGTKFYAGLDSNQQIKWVESKEDADIIKSDSEGYININGLDIGEYKIIEIKSPEGYELSKEEIPFTVIRYENGELGLEKNVEIVNQRIERIDISILKEWEDKNNQDGIRPDEITVNLIADNEVIKEIVLSKEENWKYEIKGLPKFNSEDKEIVYDIKELEVKGYNSSTEVKGKDFTITNSHNPETRDIFGGKTWNDNNNQDGKRPDSIIIRLYANGEEIKKIDTTEENGWKYIFKDLPRYENGKEIEYTVKEDEVDFYITEIKGFDIENTHIPEEIMLNGSKIWDDNEDQDGKRPKSIKVRLYANGEEIKAIDVTEETNWEFEFKELPKYEDGVEIVYTISEDEVEYYTTKINGFQIKNIHTPELTEVSGTKTWDDNNDSAGKRPKFIEVEVYKTIDEKSIKVSELKVKPDSEGNWKYKFIDLPKYENGKLINYTIKEKPVDNYKTTVIGFNIENKLIPTIPPEEKTTEPIKPTDVMTTKPTKPTDEKKDVEDNKSTGGKGENTNNKLNDDLPQTGISKEREIIISLLGLGMIMFGISQLRKKKNK